MLLLLDSSPAQPADLDTLVAAQQDPVSSLYHQWLTPAEFGARFGATDTDLAQVSAWLAAQGFTIDEISAGRRLIAFSGSAAQVAAAFRTSLHIYRINGTDHLANASDPQIPVGLSGWSPAWSLSTTSVAPRCALAPLSAQPDYSAGATHYLFPADFATIYDLNPLFSAGTNGSGARSPSRPQQHQPQRCRNLPFHRRPRREHPSVILDRADPGLVARDQRRIHSRRRVERRGGADSHESIWSSPLPPPPRTASTSPPHTS